MPITFNGFVPTDGALSAAKWNRESSSADEISVVQGPLSSGTVAQLVIRAGDSQVASGYRTEISPVTAARQAIEAEYWYFTSFFVPKSTTMPAGEKATIIQFHDGSTEPPMWFLELMDDGAAHLSQNVITLPTTGTASYQVARIPDIAERWNELVVRAYWSITAATGYIRIWLNGQEIARYDGISTYNVAGDNYFKTGFYWSRASLPSVGEWTMYSKGLIVGTGYTTFDSFMSACGSAVTEKNVYPKTDNVPSWYIDVNNDHATAGKIELAAATSVAFLAIIKPTESTAQQVIIGDNNTSFEFAIRASNQTSPSSVRLEFKDNGAGSHRGNSYNATGFARKLNTAMKWVWIAADCDFSTGAMRFWVDGAPQATTEYQDTQAAFTPAAAGATTYIGRRNTGALTFGGAMAGVWVYRSKLFTNAEIMEWWGKDTVPSGPVVYYKFNESSGNLIDYGSLGLNGTWQGSTKTYYPRPSARAQATRTVTTRTIATRATYRKVPTTA